MIEAFEVQIYDFIPLVSSIGVDQFGVLPTYPISLRDMKKLFSLLSEGHSVKRTKTTMEIAGGMVMFSSGDNDRIREPR